MNIEMSLAAKLAAVVVHSDEMLDPLLAHDFDREALKQALNDPEVKAWIKSLGPLAPARRTVEDLKAALARGAKGRKRP